MTEPLGPRYATVPDYELRTGQDVPVESEASVQQRLDDVSSLIALYLGTCAESVEAAYPDILTTLTCMAAQRSYTAPALGIRSESVVSTAVSYQAPATPVLGWLGPAETDVLDALMQAACPAARSPAGVGQLAVGLPSHGQSWAADVDVWVVGR